MDIRKRPMCWLAIGFLLIICGLTLGRSKNDILLKNGYLEERDWILFEGNIVSKEYKESVYGGYWQIVLKNVKVNEKQATDVDSKMKIFRRKSENNKSGGQDLEESVVRKLEGKYLCQITGEDNLDFKIGQRVLLEAKYSPWEEPTNIGQFDSAKYYISQGILGQFKKGKIIKVGTDYNILQEQMWKIRQNMQEILKRQLGSRDGGLIGAMLLGEKSNLNSEDKSLYQRNGISHILAISGLHLSLLGMGIYKVLLRILPGKKQAAGLCIIIMSLYCVFTGNSISTCRATIMFALSLLAIILNRSYDSLSALGLTAILQLFTNPYVLNNSGFLLSFLAVIGVVFLAPRLQQLFSCKKKSEKSLCVSLSATLTTLPVILLNYGAYPWYSVFLNLLVLPVMAFLLLCSILLLAVSGLETLVGSGNFFVALLLDLFAFVIKLILNYFEICCQGFEKLVFQDGYIGAPHGLLIVIYGILLLIVASDKVIKSTFFRKLILLCALSILTTRFYHGLEITMLDVGQGDCIVMRNNNGNVYISDCGSSSVSKVGKYRLLPFLKYKGYGKIKGIFISHMDNDHMNGILELLEMAPTEHVEIEYLFLPQSVSYIQDDKEILKEVKALAVESGTKIVYLEQGEEIQDGELRFSCLYPNVTDVYADIENRNNSSLVLFVEYEEFEMLLTGDVEKEGEKEILEYVGREVKKENGEYVEREVKKENVDVLKVAHHGSSGSSCLEFLQEFLPALSLISCSKNNSYGHPHMETLERLEDCGSKILTTVDTGAITLKINGRRMKVRQYKK